MVPPTYLSHPRPPRVAGPRPSCPQGFNCPVYTKSAPSEVSGRVFHGVPKSARSTKIDRLLELLEWWLQLAIQLRGTGMPNNILPVFDDFQPHAPLGLHTLESISKVQFSDFTVILGSVSSWLIKQLKPPFRNEYSPHLEASRRCFEAHFRLLLRAAPRCPISEC